jgi:hypothetical protein
MLTQLVIHVTALRWARWWDAAGTSLSWDTRYKGHCQGLSRCNKIRTSMAGAATKK